MASFTTVCPANYTGFVPLKPKIQWFLFDARFSETILRTVCQKKNKKHIAPIISCWSIGFNEINYTTIVEYQTLKIHSRKPVLWQYINALTLRMHRHKCAMKKTRFDVGQIFKLSWAWNMFQPLWADHTLTAIKIWRSRSWCWCETVVLKMLRLLRVKIASLKA